MSHVPAATKTLRVLKYLASQTDPVPLARIVDACDLARSTAYHLLAVMESEGFVVHLADDHRYGLGPATFEVGSGFTRQAPLQRIAWRPLAELSDATGESAHLAILLGTQVLYVIEERAPRRPPLVTDVGVRLPAHLTATGRAILAALSPPQVRALYADPSAFVERHSGGPSSLGDLRRILATIRRTGVAVEDGEVMPGLASIARPVLDHNAYPVAAVGVTFPSAPGAAIPEPVLAAVAQTARALSQRLGSGALPPSRGWT